MKKLSLLILILFLALLSGCSESIEPKSESDTLLIGQISLKANGWGKNDAGVSIDGISKGYFEISFVNISSLKEFKVTSDYVTGIFYKLNPEPGEYFIRRLYIKNNAADAGWASLWWNLSDITTSRIKIESGKVINIGSLMWVANKITKTYAIYQSDPPEQLFNSFSAQFPKSEWRQREWKNLVITWSGQ